MIQLCNKTINLTKPGWSKKKFVWDWAELTDYEDHILCPSQQFPFNVSAFLYAAGIGAIRHFRNHILGCVCVLAGVCGVRGRLVYPMFRWRVVCNRVVFATCLVVFVRAVCVRAPGQYVYEFHTLPHGVCARASWEEESCHWLWRHAWRSRRLKGVWRVPSHSQSTCTLAPLILLPRGCPHFFFLPFCLLSHDDPSRGQFSSLSLSATWNHKKLFFLKLWLKLKSRVLYT